MRRGGVDKKSKNDGVIMLQIVVFTVEELRDMSTMCDLNKPHLQPSNGKKMSGTQHKGRRLLDDDICFFILV